MIYNVLFPLSYPSRGAWCAKETMEDNLQWVQVKFDAPIKAKAILTQGGEEGYVKSYQISYSTDGISWTLYKDKQGQDKVWTLKIIRLLIPC